MIKFYCLHCVTRSTFHTSLFSSVCLLKEYVSGKQTQFAIYSLPPEALFMVQVQCRIDHGLWSEWSPMVYAEVPNCKLHPFIYFPLNEKSVFAKCLLLVAH